MMTNKNTIVINFTQLESEVRKKGRLFNASVEGEGKECILLYGAMARAFVLIVLHTSFPSCATSLTLKAAISKHRSIYKVKRTEESRKTAVSTI